MSVRTLAVVLGDQLSLRSPVLDGLDPERDAVWMAEVAEEVTQVWAHKQRIAAFFAAMRHHRDALRDRGLRVEYTALPADGRKDRGRTFEDVLAADVKRLSPERVVVVHPGDLRVIGRLRAAAPSIELVEDPRFYLALEHFEDWMRGRKRVVLEDFYRFMRKRFDVLMDDDGEPVTGRWNYDEENRASFGKAGPEGVPRARRFRPDAVTEEVIALVESRFGDHPGELDTLAWPVTRKEARAALRDFVEKRLVGFGRHQDAMWTNEPFLSHSLLSFPLNVGLLDARECVEAAVEAYEAGHAPIAAVEAFVRQILGWRELVRGLYWTLMPGYQERNALGCDPDHDVPKSYWDGETDMACVRDAMRGVLAHGYAHHIQRLMVLGLFAQLLGVHPRRFHEWHMAMYVDSIDWVSLPNALGMSQYGDGGVLGTKPYCASGAYIDRMSNYCGACRYRPKEAVGDDACPVTTLYWDFLDRHRAKWAKNGRMKMQVRNLDRKDDETLLAIRERAAWLKAESRSGRI